MDDSLRDRSIVFFAGFLFMFPVGMASIKHYSSTLFVAMILCGVSCLFSRREKLPAPNMLIIGAFIVFSCTISLSLFNVEDLRTGFKVLGKMSYMIILFPLYFVALKRPFDFLKTFAWGLAVAGPLNLLIALYSVYFQKMPRAKGFYNPIVFGDLMLLGAMLLSVFVLSKVVKGRLFSVMANISVVSFLFSCFLSGTRGAWIALPFALVAIVFLFKEKLNRPMIFQMAAGSVLLLLLIYSLPQAVKLLDVKERLPHRKLSMTVENTVAYSQGENLSSSTGQRLMMWGIAVDMFLERPLIGHGIGGFERQAEKIIKGKEAALVKAFTHTHNIYFEFLATTGALGFLAMLVSLFVVPTSVFIRALKGNEVQRLSAAAGLVSLLCFALFGLTETWLFRSPMLITYIVCLLIFSAGCSEGEKV